MLKATEYQCFKFIATILYTIRAARIIVFAAMTLAILTGCEKDRNRENEREKIINGVLNEINADSIKSHVEWLQGMGTRFAFAPDNKRVALNILGKFKAMGYADAILDSFLVTRNYRNTSYSLMQYNVIARLEGTEHPDSLFILGAHYDDIVGAGDPFTFAPGAHDNASGTAATIEVARAMKKKDYQPSRTIMFVAFGAEELGLYGSYAFTSQPGKYGKIAFMINNDMIAYEPSAQSESWIVNILDYDNSHDLRRFAEKVITNRTVLSFTNDNYYNRFSDSWPFSQAGIKAIFFSSSDNDPYYHTNNDVFLNLNFGYCSEIAKASCGILMEKQ